jgi:hypothetical protein
MSSVVELSSSLREACAALDPALLSGDAARVVAEELARTEKVLGGLRARLGLRVANSGAVGPRGDAVDWLARISGMSRGGAKALIDMAKGLDGSPGTAAALESGELSLDQAREIVATVKECPDSEADMVRRARTTGLTGLREEGRRLRARAVPPEELLEKQRAARETRTWVDALGMVCILTKFSPDVGVGLVNRLQVETDRVHKEAKREGSTESRSAHMADALASMMAGGGKRHALVADLNLVCDIRAWMRGHAHDGEVCHIIGGGPIPVDVLRKLAENAFLKVVLHDGVDIRTVSHLGRYRQAELRTALELGAPPDFLGARCSQAGCDRRDHLQWDHLDPVANNGPTSFANLDGKCPTDHEAKTERDRAAGLLGPKRAPP